MFIFKFIKFIVVAAIIFLFSYLAGNILLYPLDKINFIFLALLWLHFIDSKINVYFLAMLLGFVGELFSNLPFGIATAALLMVVLVQTWFLREIFTNRSLIIVSLSVASGLAAYRFLFFLLLAARNLFATQRVWPNFAMVAGSLWEILLSTILFTFFYFIAGRFVKKLNPAYISMSKKSVYG